MTRYVVYDVFTDTPFGGNPLAIFPDATPLPEQQLQAIAREFNFSESVFVYPPNDPENTARVRIFTPTQEIPFAGHPTIGTAIALRDNGGPADMTLELGIGNLPCRADVGRASFVTSTPLDIIAAPDPALVARALGLTTGDIATAQHPPTQASIGLPFTIVALADRETLTRCQTDLAAFHAGQAQYPTGLDFAIFAYVRDQNAIHARMFAPLDNIPEDPATGSACATLAALLHQQEDQPQNLTIFQGADMGRPSRIDVTTAAGNPPAVTVTGAAVKIMDGTLIL